MYVDKGRHQTEPKIHYHASFECSKIYGYGLVFSMNQDSGNEDFGNLLICSIFVSNFNHVCNLVVTGKTVLSPEFASK